MEFLKIAAQIKNQLTGQKRERKPIHEITKLDPEFMTNIVNEWHLLCDFLSEPTVWIWFKSCCTRTRPVTTCAKWRRVSNAFAIFDASKGHNSIKNNMSSLFEKFNLQANRLALTKFLSMSDSQYVEKRVCSFERHLVAVVYILGNPQAIWRTLSGRWFESELARHLADYWCIFARKIPRFLLILRKINAKRKEKLEGSNVFQRTSPSFSGETTVDNTLLRHSSGDFNGSDDTVVHAFQKRKTAFFYLKWIKTASHLNQSVCSASLNLQLLNLNFMKGRNHGNAPCSVASFRKFIHTASQ